LKTARYVTKNQVAQEFSQWVLPGGICDPFTHTDACGNGTDASLGQTQPFIPGFALCLGLLAAGGQHRGPGRHSHALLHHCPLLL
jgi:hypothetical protein